MMEERELVALMAAILFRPNAPCPVPGHGDVLKISTAPAVAAAREILFEVDKFWRHSPGAEKRSGGAVVEVPRGFFAALARGEKIKNSVTLRADDARTRPARAVEMLDSWGCARGLAMVEVAYEATYETPEGRS